MNAKYKEIAADIQSGFTQMLISGSTKLPSESSLCDTYHCSRQTIRSALSYLLDEGLIIKQKGCGSFISVSNSGAKLALVLPRQGEYIFAAVYQCAKRFFADLNLDLVCYDTENSLTRERKILSEFLKSPPAGIMIYPTGSAQYCAHTDLLQSLCDRNIPIVYLREIWGLPSPVLTITPDIQGATQDIASHFMEVAGGGVKAVLPLSNPNSIFQYAGLLQAAFSNNCRFEDSDILWLSDVDLIDMQNGNCLKIQETLLRAIGSYRLLLCGNDEIAYHVIKLLQACGKSVPDDISVSGFDNSYYCTMITPTITSAGITGSKDVLEACNAMLHLLTGRKAASVKLPMTRLERGSTLPPK